jgi:hypothetical protein
MKLPHCLVAAILASASLAAGAQSLKPGLWEINSRMQGSAGGQMEAQMAQMQKQMAAMPPEQRKMMEDMMAQRGMKPGAASSGGGMAMQMCMTKEMVERNQLPVQRGDCAMTSQSRTRTSLTVAFASANPPSTGEGEFTFASPEAYTSKVVVNTQVQGKPEKVTMEGSGKWLSADCGNLKPITPAKK